MRVWPFLVLCLIAGLPAGYASAGVPTPIVQRGFVTPTRNIACNAGPYRGQAVLDCTVFSAASSRGQKVWYVRKFGPAGVGFIKANAATDFAKLGYGSVWSWHGIRCVSRRTGLTCTNQSRHGFLLSRRTQRIF